ncbi:MAG: GTPase ObgE [Candidatus Zixiibacteriota bacterium]|nr:MAG: GTPase ObgE [candidate division Zixibacteria bacterium]
MFIDYVEIEITAGSGGHGCVAFHTEKFIPKGGPDGGDGGHGGSIIAQADRNLRTLLDFRYRRVYRAENGQPGSGGLKTGRSGEDTILRLPVGTIIRDLSSGQVLFDLDRPDVQFVVARGGKGGHGNAYYKSPTNQSPRKAQEGFPGESRKIALELKLLADVGLVGLPNAGKSTILSAFSQARPKIADYPFTTLTPSLGIVKFREYKSCVMADIPGLIEGASDGKGLGHQFLRHIQRTALIVYVIDINDIDIEETRQVLYKELVSFDRQLAARPTVIVVTKIDTVSESDLKDISRELPDDYIYMSAVTRQGARDFLEAIENKLDQQGA